MNKKRTLNFDTSSSFLRVFLLIILSICVIYHASGLAIFSSKINGAMGLIENISSLSLIITISVLYFFIEFKKQGIVHNYIFIAILVILFLTNLIATLCFKAPYDFQIQGLEGETLHGTFNIEGIERLKYILRFFSILLFAYLIVVIYPQKIRNNKGIIFILLIFLGLLSVLFIISYVTKFNEYINLIKFEDIQTTYTHTVSPLGLHKNTYGYLIVIGILSVILIHTYLKNNYLYIGLAFLELNLFFSMCKTGIAISAFIIAFYLLYRFFVTFKNYKKRNIIVFSIVIAILATILILYFVGLNVSTDNLLYKISTKIQDIITNKDNTISTRQYIWKNTLSIFTSNNMLLGVGFGLFGDLLFAYNYVDIRLRWINETHQAHNAWLQYLGTGGILMLLVALLAITFLVFAIVKSFKKNFHLMIVSIIILSSGIIYSFFENYPLIFGTSGELMFFNFLLFVPVLSVYYRSNELFQVNENKTFYRTQERLEVRNVFSVLTPLIAFVTSFIITLSIKNNYLLLFLLILPLGLMLVISLASKRKIAIYQLMVFLLSLTINIIISGAIYLTNIWFIFIYNFVLSMCITALTYLNSYTDYFNTLSLSRRLDNFC